MIDALKLNYARASFADYPETQIRNSLATKSRLFSQYCRTTFSGDEHKSVTNLFGLLASSLMIETIFYLPNHFRQNVLVNSNNINFLKTDSALLELMNYMFHLLQT